MATTRKLRQSAAATAERYAHDVLAGRVPACRWTKAACRRHLDDLEAAKGRRARYYFDEAAAERIVKFVELMPHVKGVWARRGERIKLEPWQIFILAVVFGWKRNADDMRRFRRAYIEVPRKNAKSTLSAPVGAYMLAADGEAGAEVYSAATTREQARIIFSVAQAQIRREGSFREAFGVEVGAHAIHVERSLSRFVPLSREADSLDGLNIHCALVDELHAHKTRDVWDVLETAVGARSQPLIWAVTTAGWNRAGICWEVRGYVQRILNSTLKLHDGLGYRVEGDAAIDDSVFGIIYTIDDGDDWMDPGAWAKANPNLGVSIAKDEIERLALKASQVASAQPNFLTKHLNVWVSADSRWMDMRAWDRCANPDLTLDDFEGEPCWLGLDLASKTDVASLAILFRRETPNGSKYILFAKHWLPAAAIEASGNSQYQGWVIEGRINETPGNVIDFAEIEDCLNELASRFEVQVVGYDPFQATQFSTRMRAAGLPMVETRQTVLIFSEPMKELEALVLKGELIHDGDPVLAWMASNVVAHRDNKDNIYPRKEDEGQKIDGVVASIMALAHAMRTDQVEDSPRPWVIEARR